VKVGQPATVTVNAASGEQFAAHVTHIASLASSSSSGGTTAVSYGVTLQLDQTGKQLKDGMSVSAQIVTARASGLTVPTQAVTGSSVTLLRNGKRTTQQVQTGLTGDSSTLIVSGLKAGDVVVVRSATATGAGGAGATGAGAQGQQQRGFGAPAGGFGGGGFGGGGGGFRGGGAGGGPPGAAP
jgi:hypothetical protein